MGVYRHSLLGIRVIKFIIAGAQPRASYLEGVLHHVAVLPLNDGFREC